MAFLLWGHHQPTLIPKWCFLNIFDGFVITKNIRSLLNFCFFGKRSNIQKNGVQLTHGKTNNLCSFTMFFFRKVNSQKSSLTSFGVFGRSAITFQRIIIKLFEIHRWKESWTDSCVGLSFLLHYFYSSIFNMLWQIFTAAIFLSLSSQNRYFS